MWSFTFCHRALCDECNRVRWVNKYHLCRKHMRNKGHLKKKYR